VVREGKQVKDSYIDIQPVNGLESVEGSEWSESKPLASTTQVVTLD
jgi:hypothetical protein